MGVWTALTLLVTWLTVSLRDLTLIGPLTWPTALAVGTAIYQRQLAIALRRLS